MLLLKEIEDQVAAIGVVVPSPDWARSFSAVILAMCYLKREHRVVG